jgi:hypothetical protein
LFVFQYFSNIFKKGSYEIKEDSLGLAEKGKVSKKEEVISKDISKKAYKLQAKELLVYFCNII